MEEPNSAAAAAAEMEGDMEGATAETPHLGT